MPVLKRGVLVVHSLLILTLILVTTSHVRAQETTKPQISVVNPSTGDGNFIFYTDATSVGDRFNVTTWVHNVSDLFAWQVKMFYNSSVLNATDAWHPTWDPNWIFNSKQSVQPSSVLGVESVLIGDSLLGAVTGIDGTGLFAVIEFEIIYGPPTGGSVFSNMKINSSDTYLLNSSLGDIPADKIDGYYEYNSLPVHNINTGLDYATIQEAINAQETLSGHTIEVDAGTYYEHVVVNKSLTLLGEDRSTTIIDGGGGGIVVRITADNVTISGFTVQRGLWGILLDSSRNSVISGNTAANNNANGIQLVSSSYSNVSGNIVADNANGIYLYLSINNTISGNIATSNVNSIYLYLSSNNTVSENIAVNNTKGIFLNSSNNNTLSENSATSNDEEGIYLRLSNNNTLSENNVVNNVNGISLVDSDNSVIIRNTVAKNDRGIVQFRSNNNSIYHNNFINNTSYQAYSLLSSSIWDNGYPSGGNYWSNYTDVDLYRGPYQNETDSDGIGDAPYVINADNQDNYPFMNPWGSQPPIANFAHSPDNPPAGETVTFDASPSYDRDGSIASYFWDFGDGTNSTGVVVGHAYADNGTYTVTLTVTDNDGLSDITSADVTVLNRPPVATFGESEETVLTDEVIYFNASASYDPDGAIVDFFWDFGDGANASGVAVSHAYVDDGTYTVTLRVTDDDGATDKVTSTKTVLNRPPVASFSESAETVYTSEAITFNASGSYDADGSIASYFWDFGDGSTITGVVADHTYVANGIYTVTLTVTDDDGATASTTTTKIVLNRLPIATFTESAETVYKGETITFNATNSYDPDGTLVSYFWDFGDRSNATGVTVEYAYTDSGNYTVTLTVTDDDGATSATTSTKTVLNRSPMASFMEAVETVYTGETITFNATDSYDSDGTIVEYFWNFGDGTNATGMVTTHSYADNGTYTVSLTVADDDGATATTAAAKTVLNRPPAASFTESAETAYTGEIIEFNASASYDPDGIIVTYFWDFGDGANATGVIVEHAYEDDGIYTVTLKITDDDGAAATTNATKTVLNRLPIASFTYSPPSPSTGETVTFNASASYDPDGTIVSYFWDFGDGTNGTDVIVSHSYVNDGVYTVTLTIEDAGGNIATDTVTIIVLLDTDGDGTPDVSDQDDDNDGVNDVDDAFPLDSSESLDTDEDGIGNNADSDDDNDGMPDTWEIENGLNSLDSADASLDRDGDGLTNFQEYQQGTDPNVSDVEAFPLWIIGVVGGVIMLVLIAILVLWRRRSAKIQETD